MLSVDFHTGIQNELDHGINSGLSEYACTGVTTVILSDHGKTLDNGPPAKVAIEVHKYMIGEHIDQSLLFRMRSQSRSIS